MAEAGVALSAVGVEDPQRRPPPWWAGAIARDDHLRSLADDVSTEPDPRPTRELEADPGRLADRAIEAPGASARWLQHDEADPGSPRERRKPSESIAESRPRDAGLLATARLAAALLAAARLATARLAAARLGATRLDGQVDDQQVHGASREQRAGDGEPFLRVRRRQHDQPLRLDAARHRLDRIERRREVEPRDDRARRLGGRDQPQRQRGPPARDLAADREPHAARQATGAEDRIELGEAGRMHPIVIDRPVDRRAARGAALRIRIRAFNRHRRERADHLAGKSIAREPARSPLACEPGRRRTPARAKGRQRGGEVGRGSSHTCSIEQMFE